MTLPRFDRAYRLLVGKKGAMGNEVLPPIGMTFDIYKDASETPNQAQIRVFNLAPETRKAWEEPDSVAILYAGYAEEQGAVELTTGNIVDAWTKVEGPDVITEITLADGYVPMRDTTITLSYGSGVSADEIIKTIASKMGLPLQMGSVPNRTWAHGFSFYGSAHEALHKVVRGTGLEWSVQNGRLIIVEDGKPNAETVYVLNASSGLIGYPERMRKGARETAKVKDKVSGDDKHIVSSQQQKDGWRVTSLLLPDIEPTDRVKIESKTVTGVFRVESVRHNGDWGGSGDWHTTLEVTEL